MEAATNYLVANNDDVELLKDSSFNVSVTANESFTGQEVESYLTTIIDNCKGIIKRVVRLKMLKTIEIKSHA